MAAAIGAYLLPLEGTRPQPGDGEAADLAAIANAIGDADLVGLGEDFHGVHDNHTLAHRIFAYLADQKGFDVFALEVDFAHAALLDDYLHGRRDDLDALLARRSPWAIFYDAALRDLLLYLREQNLEQGRNFSVAGFDHKQPALAAERLVATLRRFDPATAAEVERLAGGILALGGFGINPNDFGYSGYFFLRLPPSPEARTLVARVRARAQGMTYGSASLDVDTAGGKENSAQRVVFPAAELSESWRLGELSLNVPPDSGVLRCFLYHGGNGTLFFGGLELELDGQKLELPSLANLKLPPLLFPGWQVMDYTARLDPEAAFAGQSALRIDVDPRLDSARADARELLQRVRASLDRHPTQITPREAAWTLQLARTVEQALLWRTLAEPNRDVFLAENLAWLHQEGFSGHKIVALAHAQHSQPIPDRMGGFLTQTLGPAYFTLSFFTLSGSVRDDLPPTFARQVHAINPEELASLPRHLGPLHSGHFLVDLAAARRDPAARAWLAQLAPTTQRDEYPPAMAIFLREVTPLQPLADGLEERRCPGSGQ